MALFTEDSKISESSSAPSVFEDREAPAAKTLANHHPRVSFVTAAVTIYAVIYQLLVAANGNIHLILLLFAFSPFALCYMAYVILRYGEPSKDRFEDKFYEDSDYRRLRTVEPRG